MKKYRFKTKEEFELEGLWIDDEYCNHPYGGYPDNW